MVGRWSYKEDYLQIFKCVSWLHGCCGKWVSWSSVNRFNYTSWVAVVTPTDRPKSVRNILVAFCVVTLLFGFYVVVGAFVIGMSRISSFFLFWMNSFSGKLVFRKPVWPHQLDGCCYSNWPSFKEVGPQSLSNRSFCWRFVCCHGVFWILCGCKGFCHRNESDLFLFLFWMDSFSGKRKGRDLTQSYDKSPYTNRNVKRAKWQHKQRHKKVRLNSGCGPT